MAYKITDGCIGCGACEGTCPVGAISNDGSVCVIDAGKFSKKEVKELKRISKNIAAIQSGNLGYLL